jgi:hypothetical protein
MVRKSCRTRKQVSRIKLKYYRNNTAENGTKWIWMIERNTVIWMPYIRSHILNMSKRMSNFTGLTIFWQM